MTFRLSPGLDRKGLAERFAAAGRVRMRPFLAGDGAEELHRHLTNRTDWVQLIGGEDKVFEIDRGTRAQFTSQRVSDLDAAVFAAARDDFQFRFESIRVPDGADARARLSDPLARFARWMASVEVLEFMQEVTGDRAIRFADAQATGYASGDFLTAHDDLVVGKDRKAAYVLGLTPIWRLEWGGLLIYHHPDDRFEGYQPAFNSLDLFRVPQIHSVSLVSPAANAIRLSVTGWLRDMRMEEL